MVSHKLIVDESIPTERTHNEHSGLPSSEYIHGSIADIKVRMHNTLNSLKRKGTEVKKEKNPDVIKKHSSNLK